MTPPLPVGGVLTLDLAGVAGWAYGPLDAAYPYCDHVIFPAIGGEGMRYASFENWLAALIVRLRPTAMVLESPLPLPAMNNRRSAFQQITLRGLAYSEGYRASVPVSEIDADTARMEVLGQCRWPGGELKAAIVAALRARGVPVRNHNAADAGVIWLWHKQRVRGVPRLAGPLWRAAIEADARETLS